MFFSILVPVYNAEAYLGACIDSVFGQSEQDFELILVNDGSVDDSGMLCDRCRALHPNVVKVRHRPNKGLISARREGIAMAEGRYCIFLDADDYLEPDCLLTVRNTIEYTDADVVIFNYYNRFDQTHTTTVSEAVFPDNTLFSGEQKRAVYEELIASWRLNNLCTKAIRTELVRADDTPYEQYFGSAHTEDLLQSLYPVTNAERIVYRALPLYNYRRIDDSISTRVQWGNIENQFNDAVMARLRHYMTVWGMDTPEALERFHVRKLNGLLTLFWQHYRAADTEEKKRMVLDFPWEKHMDDADKTYLDSANLPPQRRAQLKAILKKDGRQLDRIAWLADMKARLRHGE